MTTVVSRIRRPHTAAAAPLTAQQVAKAYNYPATTGAGRTIAIIELGGGFGAADLRTYFGSNMPDVKAITVDGGSNTSDGADGADGEVLLDIEVAFSVAPGAKGRVYFCGNTDSSFLAGIKQATVDLSAGDAISISWGGPESSWQAGSLTSFDAAFAAARAKGINVFAAAGDSGADDGTGSPVVDFPASSPNVVACGGTRLELNGDGSRASETTWDDSDTSSATGGGVSTRFPGRDVPDVAGNADPDTGYKIVVDGGRYVVGGTSAVAPLYAGLAVLLAETVGPFDFLTAVTSNPSVCFDVTAGDNGAYRAGPGRDETTGFGVVDGSRMLAALQTASAPTPAPPSGSVTYTFTESDAATLNTWAARKTSSRTASAAWKRGTVAAALAEALTETQRADTAEVYRDASGKWRWRRLASNHAVIGSSGESFSSLRAAKKAAARANPDVTVQVAE